jgi:hypothetical protein
MTPLIHSHQSASDSDDMPSTLLGQVPAFPDDLVIFEKHCLKNLSDFSQEIPKTYR